MIRFPSMTIMLLVRSAVKLKPRLIRTTDRFARPRPTSWLRTSPMTTGVSFLAGLLRTSRCGPTSSVWVTVSTRRLLFDSRTFLPVTCLFRCGNSLSICLSA